MATRSKDATRGDPGHTTSNKKLITRRKGMATRSWGAPGLTTSNKMLVTRSKEHGY